jgi:hypothetical protein
MVCSHGMLLMVGEVLLLEYLLRIYRVASCDALGCCADAFRRPQLARQLHKTNNQIMTTVLYDVSNGSG